MALHQHGGYIALCSYASFNVRALASPTESPHSLSAYCSCARVQCSENRV